MAIKFCLAGLAVEFFPWLCPTRLLMDIRNADLSSNEPENVTVVICPKDCEWHDQGQHDRECHAAVSQRGAPPFPPRS
jgi:hypothetical protein